MLISMPRQFSSIFGAVQAICISSVCSRDYVPLRDQSNFDSWMRFAPAATILNKFTSFVSTFIQVPVRKIWFEAKLIAG